LARCMLSLCSFVCHVPPEHDKIRTVDCSVIFQACIQRVFLRQCRQRTTGRCSRLLSLLSTPGTPLVKLCAVQDNVALEFGADQYSFFGGLGPGSTLEGALEVSRSTSACCPAGSALTDIACICNAQQLETVLHSGAHLQLDSHPANGHVGWPGRTT